MNVIGEIYKPFDTVEIVNKNVASRPLRLALNWILLVSSCLFLLAAVYAIVTNRSRSRIAIEIYLFVLISMLITDAIATYFETRAIVRSGIHWDRSGVFSLVSLSISVIVGIVAYVLMREQWCHYTAGRTSARISFTLLVLKMALAAMIAVKSGNAIRHQRMYSVNYKQKFHIFMSGMGIF